MKRQGAVLKPKSDMDRVLMARIQQRIWEMGPDVLRDLKRICDLGPEAIGYMHEVMTSREMVTVTTGKGFQVTTPRFSDELKLGVVRIWLAAEEMILARTAPTLQAVKVVGQVTSGADSKMQNLDWQQLHREAIEIANGGESGNGKLNGGGIH